MNGDNGGGRSHPQTEFSKTLHPRSHADEKAWISEIVRLGTELRETDSMGQSHLRGSLAQDLAALGGEVLVGHGHVLLPDVDGLLQQLGGRLQTKIFSQTH